MHISEEIARYRILSPDLTCTYANSYSEFFFLISLQFNSTATNNSGEKGKESVQSGNE